jgi:hypothetical protein
MPGTNPSTPSSSASSGSQPSDVRTRGTYQVYSTFKGSDQVAADTPYLIAPNTQYNAAIAVAVENLYQLPASGPPTPPAIENDDFKFAWSVADLTRVTAANADNVKALITIKNNNCWKTAGAARQALRANFADFCARIEALEINTRTLAPGGATVIAQRIAEALPAPINESLYYSAGLNAGFGLNSSPSVDLLPGMRLRVDFAANQFVGPGSPLNGMVGAGQFYYSIGRDGNQRVVFDAFLGAIAAPETTAPLGQSTASGLFDLQASGAARRHYRLFYPTQLPPATAPGDNRLTRNVTLIGADTLADLTTATNAYTASGEIGAAATGNLPIIAVSFRGRAVAVPEIGVYVNRRVGDYRQSTLIYVPLGTTLRQLLDQQAGTWNPLQLYGESGTITLRRFWSEDNGVPQYRKVMLNSQRVADARVFDVPLVKSDMLDITFDVED